MDMALLALIDGANTLGKVVLSIWCLAAALAVLAVFVWLARGARD